MTLDRLALLHRVWGVGYYLQRAGCLSGVRNAADRLCVALAHMFLPVAGRA